MSPVNGAALYHDFALQRRNASVICTSVSCSPGALADAKCASPKGVLKLCLPPEAATPAALPFLALSTLAFLLPPRAAPRRR